MPSADASFRLLQEKITEAMERLHVPGVAVGVLHEGAEHIAGFGVTNVDHLLPVDGDTLFQIGSTTKTVTGTAAMRLVEMGKLDLDAPIRTYLPDLRMSSEEVAAKVTMRHLFTHTGGWVGDYFEGTGSGDDALAKVVVRMADLEQITPLGAVWSYNNSGFYLAGRVIEVLTGKTYEEAVTELVLDPLGMKRSFFFAADVITHRVAAGHYIIDARPVVTREWALPRAAHPAGGIVSTVGDQLRYARFHMGDGTAPDGTRLLAPESVAFMQTPLVEGSGGNQWGLAWGLRKIGDARLVFHGGATSGQLSAFMMVPQRRFAITVLTNADRGVVLHNEVVKWALEEYLGLVEPEAQRLEIPEAGLASYAGRYVGAGSTSDLELIVRDGGITMQVHIKGGFPDKDSPPPPTPPPMRLAFLDTDRIMVLDEPMKGGRGEFLRNTDGSIAWLRLSRIRARQA
ncbi:MAG: serine hydrolase domain-containing protein [bacterium]